MWGPLGTCLALTALVLSPTAAVAAELDAASAPAVSVFVTGVRGRIEQARLAPLVDAVTQAFGETGRAVVPVEIGPRNAPRVELSDIRGVAADAFAMLSAGDDPASILELYEAPIERALDHATFVRNAEGRKLLWNTCLLQVQLLLMRDGPDAASTRAAVSECRRKFPGPRKFSEAWPQNVIHAFSEAPSAPVQVSLRSSPSGCHALLFGENVGPTPLNIRLEPGHYDIQLRCAEETLSGVHEMRVPEIRELTVRLSADRAFHPGPKLASALLYDAPPDLDEAARDAATLAREAGAEGFVLLQVIQDRVHLQWYEAQQRRGTASVALSAPQSAHVAAAHALLQRTPAAVADDRTRATASPPPTRNEEGAQWADYTIGTALALGGAVLVAYPASVIAREGDCANTACTRIRAHSTPARAVLGVGGALLTSGIAWVIWRPIDKRRKTRLSAGIGGLRIEGRF